MSSYSAVSHLNTIQQNIRTLESTQQLPKNKIKLVAVSKTRSADEIRALAEHGQLDYGENYVQEAIDKMTLLDKLDLTWHFIGPIQKNKTKLIAQHFDWVQSIDRSVVATRLNNQRPEHLAALNVCIQINIDNETTKSGISADETEALAEHIQTLPKLRLRGLMAIPAINPSNDSILHPFVRMRELFDKLCAKGFNLDTLSMGMSNDYALAIESGATLVRIGTAIFGPRK